MMYDFYQVLLFPPLVGDHKIRTEVLMDLVPIGGSTPLVGSRLCGCSRSISGPIGGLRNLASPVVGDLWVGNGGRCHTRGSQSWSGFVGPIGGHFLTTPRFFNLADGSLSGHLLGLELLLPGLLLLLGFLRIPVKTNVSLLFGTFKSILISDSNAS